MAKKTTRVRLNFSIDNADRDPLGTLRGITKAMQGIQAHVPELVNRAREQRCTWAEIGDALGTTRQAAWERFSTD
jgi:ATP-dependent Clp protease ATP-binding subunit ClpX